MIPVLYAATETDFNNNGLGRLPDCVSCDVTEERNGVFELELVYPTTGVNFYRIEIGHIIYVTHDALKTPQPFEIYKKSTPINGQVTFSAHHVSYRLSDVVVAPFTMTGTAGEAMAALGTHAVNSCPFTFYSTRSTSLPYKVSKPETLRRLLGGVEGSILDIYGGGDYTFDKFTVSYGTRGADHGVTIRYGKNMTDLTAEEDTEGVYDGLVPFWANQDTMVTLPEWYVGTSGRLAPLDLSGEWSEPPTESQLRTKAQAMLTSTPDENITVSFVVQPEDWADIENLQRVALCDTVSVIYPGGAKKIRVIKTVYDPLSERYKSVELGTPKASLADTIKNRTVDEVLKQTITEGFMTQAIADATDLIAGGLGGHVVIGRNADGEPEEILIMDTDDIQTAVNVIRMNQAGIGFSTTGYAGPFTSAWTIDGTFNTAFINVAYLSVLSANAGTITAGVLQSSDYAYSSGTYTTSGMIIDLNNKIIRTPKTAILADGSVHATDGDFQGTVRSTTGNNTVTLSSDANSAYVIAKNNITELQLRANADGSVGIYENPYPFTYEPDALLVRGGNAVFTTFNFSSTKDIYAATGVGVNKTSGQDGNAGFWANSAGNVYLTGSTNAGSTIYFYFNKATSSTAYITESASGALYANAYFSAKDYSGSVRRVVTSGSTDGNRIAYFSSNATTLYINGQHGTTGSTYSSKNITFSSSDIRLKQNIKPSTVDALALINQIQVREFDWTDDREDPHQIIGVVADELEELDPKLAVGGGYDEDGTINIKSVDTFYLTGYLVKAVQELTEEVERLKQEVKKCKR